MISIFMLINIRIIDRLYLSIEKCLVIFVSRKYMVCRLRMVNRFEVSMINGLVVIVKIVGILLMVKIMLFSFIRISISSSGVVNSILFLWVKKCLFLILLVICRWLWI